MLEAKSDQKNHFASHHAAQHLKDAATLGLAQGQHIKDIIPDLCRPSNDQNSSSLYNYLRGYTSDVEQVSTTDDVVGGCVGLAASLVVGPDFLPPDWNTSAVNPNEALAVISSISSMAGRETKVVHSMTEVIESLRDDAEGVCVAIANEHDNGHLLSVIPAQATDLSNNKVYIVADEEVFNSNLAQVKTEGPNPIAAYRHPPYPPDTTVVFTANEDFVATSLREFDEIKFGLVIQRPEAEKDPIVFFYSAIMHDNPT